MFAKLYRAAAEKLLGSLGGQPGLSEEFLEQTEEGLGLRLPLALRDYYVAVGALRDLNDAHDQLLGPANWFVDAGKLAFMVENQAVVYWGVEATERPNADPPVFLGVNAKPIEWHPTHDRCSEFLLVMMHWQAVCGGLEFLGMAEAGGKTVKHFEQEWRRVGEVEGLLAFCREGQAACFMGEGDARQLYVGGRSEEELERVAGELAGIGVRLDHL